MRFPVAPPGRKVDGDHPAACCFGSLEDDAKECVEDEGVRAENEDSSEVADDP